MQENSHYFYHHHHHHIIKVLQLVFLSSVSMYYLKKYNYAKPCPGLLFPSNYFPFDMFPFLHWEICRNENHKCLNQVIIKMSKKEKPGHTLHVVNSSELLWLRLVAVPCIKSLRFFIVLGSSESFLRKCVQCIQWTLNVYLHSSSGRWLDNSLISRRKLI